jgi:hypothetical protein
MKLHRLICLLGALGVIQSALADVAPLKDLPGSIPLGFERQCAADLVYQGKSLQPDEACALHKEAEAKFIANGKKDPSLRFDISRLEPDPKSYLMKGSDGSQAIMRPKDVFEDVLNYEAKKQGESAGGYYDDLKAMEIKDEGEVVEYRKTTEMTTGKLGFQVEKKNAKGETIAFQLRLDLIGHNLLMRKTLLRKIGYHIPLMDRLKTVKVKFRDSFEKDTFLAELKDNTFTEPSRWVIEGEKTKDDMLTLQDVIVTQGARDSVFNVARGSMVAQLIQGRRLLNALYIPFALTHAYESLNLTRLSAGEIFNGQLSFDYGDTAKQFSPSYEDARWIARKIMALTRQDWIEIVASAKIPTEPGIVMVEKLLSRRNTLREQLHLDKESGHLDARNETSVAIPVNLEISRGERLIEGKLVGKMPTGKKLKDLTDKEKEDLKIWPGYARQFNGIDPDSPLSGEEMFGFAKAQVLYNIVRNVVAQFNKHLPNSDDEVNEAAEQHKLSILAGLSDTQLMAMLRNQEAPSVPRNLWTTKFYRMFAIPDRDVIIGNYMGAQNQIQVVDSLTVGAEAGWLGFGEGLPPRMGLSARAKMVYTKNWMHTKPVTSMKKALKQPFKNVIVPYFENQLNAPLGELMNLKKGKQDIANALKAATQLQKDAKTPEEKAAAKAKMDEVKALQTTWDENFKKEIGKFNDMFGTNESIMVTTSVGPDFSVVLSKGLNKDIGAYLRARDRMVDLSRLHIFRKSTNKVQIYFDPTLYNDFSFGVGLMGKIPIFSMDWSFKNGRTTTYFFEYNINSNLKENPEFFDSVVAISAALKGANRKFFESSQTPMVIRHKFDDDTSNFNFLALRRQGKETEDIINVKNTDGQVQNYIRLVDGNRNGVDFQTLMVNVTAALLQKHYPKLELSINTSGDAGDTIGGTSVARQVTVEAETTPIGLRKDNLLATLNYKDKGWSASRKKTEEKFEELNKYFNQACQDPNTTRECKRLFKKEELYQTKEAQFYNLRTQISLYREAIDRISTLTEKEVHQIFNEHGTNVVINYDRLDEPNSWAIKMVNQLEKMQEYWIKDPHKAAKALTSVLEVAQNKLDFQGLVKLVGGAQNMFIRGTFDGFRKGDERGQYSLDTPTMGRIGSREEPFGPMAPILEKTGITNGELFISWLLSPLI